MNGNNQSMDEKIDFLLNKKRKNKLNDDKNISNDLKALYENNIQYMEKE